MPHEKEHKIRVEDIFQQSPIPQPPPTITDEEFNRVFNERSRKFQEEKQGLRDRWQEHLDTTGILDKEEEKKEEGGLLDWLISPARGEGGLEIDKKHPPMWQLADAEFRTQLNPQGVAKFSRLYGDPSGQTGLAYYKPWARAGYSQFVDAFHMDTPSALGESLWGGREAFEPNQIFRHGKSYLATPSMDQGRYSHLYGGTRSGPADDWHHEAFHDASVQVTSSEFMPQPYKTMYQYLTVVKGMGIQIEEALAQYHDSIYPKSPQQRLRAVEWLEEEMEEARDQSVYTDNTVQDRRVWELYLNTLENLGIMYDAILGAAQQRHKSLGYK